MKTFDRIVLGSVLLLAIGLTFWLGRRFGNVARLLTPSSPAKIGITTPIKLHFNEQMQTKTVLERIALQPAVAGQWQWQNNDLLFVPQPALQPDTTYQLTLQGGVVNWQGERHERSHTWTIQTRQPELVIISPSDKDRELWRVPVPSDNKINQTAGIQLTQSGGRVYDFAVSHSGHQIVYGVENDLGGIDLYLTNSTGDENRLLLACELSRCSAAAWSMDDTRLLFNREPPPLNPGSLPSPPRIWSLDVSSGQTAPLYKDSNVLGYSPTFSPDGKRVAFFNSDLRGIHVLELETLTEQLLPSWTGLVGEWSPDGQHMLYNEFKISTERQFTITYDVDLIAKETRPLFDPDQEHAWGEAIGIPTWQPTNNWLALSARPNNSGAAAQLWLVRSDGTDGHAIAADPQYTYGAYRWQPAGKQIVYQRFALNQAFAAPSVLVYDLATNSTHLVRNNASNPQWLP
jgi:TolB protein